ncbi:MAG: YihY/virulence factor BrkB family protein [Ruminococcaceae bacterium]|nr:YihY/virulence factor BrkB family protein [Oscillospiraceae bacterium]
MNELIKNVKYLARKITASRIGAYAAQTAFFMFLSLIPLIMLLISILKQLGTSESAIYILNDNLLPGVFNSFFSLYVDEIVIQSTPSMTIVSILVLLWSASKGIYAIIGGLNSVYEIKETRNYFLIRLASIFYTVSFMAILVSALSILVFGDKINEILISLFPHITGLVYIISSLRFIIGFVLLVLLFSILYKALPSGKQRFSEQIPGAVISSAGWVSFSILFSFFVDNFSNYANIYGSLTAIIVLLLWLYVCMYIMFVGAKINFILSAKTNG